MRARADGETFSGSRKARDTVIGDSFATRATSTRRGARVIAGVALGAAERLISREVDTLARRYQTRNDCAIIRALRTMAAPIPRNPDVDPFFPASLPESRH